MTTGPSMARHRNAILQRDSLNGNKRNYIGRPHARMGALVKASLDDVKTGGFVGVTSLPDENGNQKALEIHIFPEALRGTGEGQRPWDVKPDGVMTNATVGTVSQSPDGGVIHVTYKGGESEYSVGGDVLILLYVADDRSLLKPGAALFLLALKKPDGTLTANRVTAEKDGVKPPF